MKQKRPTSETERIEKMLTWMFVVLLIIISGCIALGVFALRDYKTGAQNYTDLRLKNVELTPGKDGISITGERGPQGIQGESVIGPKGDDGKDGKDGQSIVGPQGVSITGEKGDKGDTGEKGEQGEPGKAVFIRQNPETNETECRYAGDTMWKPAEECAG